MNKWGREKTNLPCRRIPSNLCRYSVLKEVEFNFLLLKCGLHAVNFFEEYSIERGMGMRESHFIVKKPNKYYLS